MAPLAKVVEKQFSQFVRFQNSAPSGKTMIVILPGKIAENKEEFNTLMRSSFRGLDCAAKSAGFSRHHGPMVMKKSVPGLQSGGLHSIHIRQDGPDDIVRKTFSLQKSGKPPPAGLTKRVERFQFLQSRCPRRPHLNIIVAHARQRFRNDIPLDPFVPELPLDPAPAKTPQPEPAGSPLFGELPVINVTVALQICKNSLDDSAVKTLLLQLSGEFCAAPGPVRKQTVGGAFGPR
jgi:hypothetical protein